MHQVEIILVVAVKGRVRFRKKVMAYRKSLRRSRGDWPDRTSEANLVLFQDGLGSRYTGPAISVSTDKSADIAMNFFLLGLLVTRWEN